MVKRYIIVGVLVFAALHLRSQEPADSLFKKNTLNKTEIDLLYQHYIQDGNNSAVTGGVGTEKLRVYAPAIALRKTFKERHTVGIDAGVDIISSASTDNIDFNVSSASILDARSHINISYSQQLKNKDLSISGGTGFSIESDYFSIPLNAAIHFGSKNRMRTYSFQVQAFFDDLRWGRLNSENYRPVRLIYPQELRYREWFDIHNRYSYNFRFGFTQTLNKRNILGIFPEFAYQRGLLSTPFHRVYFNNGELRVENLPNVRNKASLGIRLNSFVGGMTILKNELDFYIDDFGVAGLALANETAFKLNELFSVAPFFRFYIQNGSKYFAPYREHTIDKTFYTSDYDLSGFITYKAGMNFRYAPFRYVYKKAAFNELQLRYAFFYRNNQLRAHIISIVIKTAFGS